MRLLLYKICLTRYFLLDFFCNSSFWSDQLLGDKIIIFIYLVKRDKPVEPDCDKLLCNLFSRILNDHPSFCHPPQLSNFRVLSSNENGLPKLKLVITKTNFSLVYLISYLIAGETIFNQYSKQFHGNQIESYN